jgi:hypothetical protein
MRTTMLVVLLADADKSTGSIVLWSSVLVLALVALFGVVVFYRKWMSASDAPSAGPAFTLSDLRKLHKEGKMTTDEYEKAKAVIIGSLKAGAPEPPDKGRGLDRDPPHRAG